MALSDRLRKLEQRLKTGRHEILAMVIVYPNESKAEALIRCGISDESKVGIFVTLSPRPE